jgi:short-subunit dehydrogenase
MNASPVVVITGASSGLGRGTALAFAKLRARLVLVGRSTESLEAVAAECAAAGNHNVLTVAGDVVDTSTAERAVDMAIAAFGRLDVWVNDASVGSYAPFWELPTAEFERILDVNIHGAANGSRSALRVMLRQRSGLIVNIASILGEVPQPYNAAYSMSKAAVIALGRSLRSELSLAKSPVHVVTVLPPTLDTPFFHHAGNHTGRALQALPPVYPPTEAVKAIIAAWKHPSRAERVVGAAGRTMVSQHRKRPRAIEAALARQTELGQFQRGPAPDTLGNLESPSTAPLGVTGGWGGHRRQAARMLLATALAAGAAYAVGRSRRSES